MQELIKVMGNDIFTDSKIIAEGTGNQHEAVQKIINKYGADIEDFGALRFEMRVLKHENYKGSTREKIYYLNEEQATFIITLLRNSKKVVEFKKELVRQFYQMRKFILEKQSKEWQETRRNGKLIRREETDTIQRLIEYAKEQGSEHADKLYLVYSKLANSIVGISNRDEATIIQLNNLSMMEHIILCVIDMGIITGKHYKEIYQDCKQRVQMVKDLAFLEQVI
ncbi:MAG: Rha family transcriptional regulator, partial [Lachnospiraceae bacterium]